MGGGLDQWFSFQQTLRHRHAMVISLLKNKGSTDYWKILDIDEDRAYWNSSVKRIVFFFFLVNESLDERRLLYIRVKTSCRSQKGLTLDLQIAYQEGLLATGLEPRLFWTKHPSLTKWTNLMTKDCILWLYQMRKFGLLKNPMVALYVQMNSWVVHLYIYIYIYIYLRWVVQLSGLGCRL